MASSFSQSWNAWWRRDRGWKLTGLILGSLLFSIGCTHTAAEIAARQAQEERCSRLGMIPNNFDTDRCEPSFAAPLPGRRN